MATRMARVLSVNVRTVREFEYHGRPAKSAIWKSPVAGRIAARGVNLDGDAQADREAHGGPDKAIYAYARTVVGTGDRPTARGTTAAPNDGRANYPSERESLAQCEIWASWLNV
jgi:hypothetical protein